MSTLFIGGPADGKRVDVPNEPYIRLPIENAFRYPGDMIRTQTYRREMLDTETGRLVFYVAEPLTAFEVIKKMIENYKPEKP